MKLKLIYIIIILLMLTAGISSCKKTLDVSSTHLVPEAQMWKVKNDARSAVFATYGLMRAALANNNAYFVYGELRAGDFVSTSDPDLRAVSTNNLNATSSTMDEWKNWRRFYAVIAQANICLAKLPLVHKNDFRYTTDELTLDMANVRFLRALAYFYLVRIWGNVPLVTNFNENGFKAVQREDWHKVLAFATQETEDALNNLPWQYNGNFPEQQGQYWEQNGSFWQGIVATKGTAYDLLAHIAAWEGDYLDAANYCLQIMNNTSNNTYQLAATSDLTSTSGGVFSGQDNDIIFALPFNNLYQESSATGHIEAWTLATPYISRQLPEIYVPNDTIINMFNVQGDQRFSINSNGSGTGNYFTNFGSPVPMFSKIRQLSVTTGTPFQSYQSAIVIFRYEEVVLLRAEAMFFLGKTNDATNLLNSIREKRGLPDYTPVEGSLEDAILEERRRELLGEGWHWFDLIRFGKVSEYTGLSQQDIQKGALLWPISPDILEGNPNIQQNSFWQH